MFVAVKASDGSSLNTMPKFSQLGGYVNLIVPDGSGGFFIGGNFNEVGSLSRSEIAHINPDGSEDSNFNANPNGEVHTIVLSNGVLYVGGDFVNIGGASRNYIAALDPTTGTATSWNPNASADVNQIVVSGGTVYAIGDFSTIGGASRSTLAALSTTTGLATSWNPNPNFSAFGMDVDGGILYVGGLFTSIGGASRDKLAAFDTTTGLVTSWNPGSNASVPRIKVRGSIVYVAGGFSSIGGASRNNIAALSTTTGLATSWNPNPNGNVYGFYPDGTSVYVAGDFTSVGGAGRKYIAELNTSNGDATSWSVSTPSEAKSIFRIGSTVLIGGAFITVNGIEQTGIVELDSTGVPTSWNANANGTVRSIETSGANLYLGGAFSSVGGQTRNNLAAVNSTSAAVTSWNPNANNQVMELTKIGSIIYIGGYFTSLSGGSDARTYLAAVHTDGTVQSWAPILDGFVRDIATDGSNIYVDGDFLESNGTPRITVAAFDASGALTSWDPNPDNFVYDVYVDGSTIYIAGAFTTLNGGSDARNFVAATQADGTILSFDPQIDDAHEDNNVVTITKKDSLLYLGGKFSSLALGTYERDQAVAVHTDGTVQPWSNTYTNSLNFLGYVGSRLHVSGTISAFNSDPQYRYYAHFTEGDVTAPTISAILTTPSDTSATIIWTTNEAASSRIDYGVTAMYNTSTSETDTSPRVTSHSVNISGLTSCSTYNFRARSKDSTGNERFGTNSTFTTTGCTGSSNVSDHASVSITDEEGGEVSLMTGGSTITLTVPSNFSTSDADFQILKLNKTSVLNGVGAPAGQSITDHVYELRALEDIGTAKTSFDNPITITLQYENGDFSPLTESSLIIYSWDGASWQALSDCSVDTTSNTITCSTTHFSTFGLFGQSSNGSSTSSSSTSSTTTNSNSGCSATAPKTSPDLFQINATSSSATLYLTTLGKKANKYLVEYGLKSNAPQYSTVFSPNQSLWIASQEIKDLAPNTTYYFRVSGANDCASGPAGKELSIKTSAKGSNSEKIYYKSSKTSLVQTSVVRTETPAASLKPVAILEPVKEPSPTPRQETVAINSPEPTAKPSSLLGNIFSFFGFWFKK